MVPEVESQVQRPVRSEAERRKRINRLKKMILITIALAILLPVILCLVLLFKVNRLEHKVRELEAARDVSQAMKVHNEEMLSPGEGESDHLMPGQTDLQAANKGDASQNGAASLPTEGDGEPTLAGSADDAGGTADGMDGMADGRGNADGTAGADGMDSTDSAADVVGSNTDVEAVSAEQMYEGYRKVYLTFDDGPSMYTDDILDILDRYQIRATFFVVGKTDAHSREMYQRIVEDGHTLGMHSYSHVYRDIYSSVDAFTQDLEKLSDYLYEVTGVSCRFYRFPGGSSNTVTHVGILDLIDVLNERGIVYFDWNVMSGDAGSTKLTVDQLTENVLNHLDEYHTAVVLMHDSGDKPESVEALPVIIERILAMDNTVILPISDNTVVIQHVKSDHDR